MFVANKLSLVFLVISLTGSSLLGVLQKHCHKNAPLIIKKKRKKVEVDVKNNREETGSPELFFSPLIVDIDPKVEIQKNNEKYKKLAEVQVQLPEITTIPKIDLDELILLKKIFEKNKFFLDTEGGSCQRFLLFETFVKDVFFDSAVTDLDLQRFEVKKDALNKTRDFFYCVNWSSVCSWTDVDNYERVEKCGCLSNEYSSGCIYDDVDRDEYFKLIKGQYKIHIMPKDKTEGMRVVSLLLYLLKNNSDFRKYAYAFKFLVTFSLDRKDRFGQTAPVFVIYTVWGKKNAQNVLNIIALALKQIEFVGSPVIPRYNFTVGMQGLTAAMGDADFKPSSVFDKTKNYSVCNSSDDPSQEPFELTLSSLK